MPAHLVIYHFGLPLAKTLVSKHMYGGPTSIVHPKFSRPAPREFARHRIVLENLLPLDGNYLFKYLILVEHLKSNKTKLIAEAYLN